MSPKHTLGTIRLQNSSTKELILIPQPSSDPSDPLNWSKPFRYYMATLVCLAMVMCNFLAAGPTIAIIETTLSFFPSATGVSDSSISKISYFFTTASLMQGLGNLVWMPLAVKYGKRPVYLASFMLYFVTAIWVGLARTYSNALVARIVMGFAAGSAEFLAPLTISDLFFLHERGLVMAFYTASLNFGCSIGIIASGFITVDLGWRSIYWIASAIIGLLTIVVFFTMPETSFKRCKIHTLPLRSKEGELSLIRLSPPARYLSSLRLYQSTMTSEPWSKLFLRPLTMLLSPSVLWATLVMAATIGFLVAITSNVADAFADTYDFEPWQSGLCFVAGFIGSVIGIVFGGWFSDRVANVLTERNGGIRESEFRLPAIGISLITAPLALILYGVGIERELHWMVPTSGLGLLNFSVAQATNVSLCYIIDSYRPVADEAVVAQLAFKSAFGFLLSFYTNPWSATCGYEEAFSEMAGISAAILLLWIPVFLYGKQLRQASLSWPIIVAGIGWNADREVGE